MRLIDADKIIEELTILAKYEKGTVDDKCNTIFGVIKTINLSATIDAVSVVRCKDCKWFYESDTEICCTKHTGLALARKDDYCSYGERIK